MKLIGRPFYNHVILIGSAARGLLPFHLGHDTSQGIEDAVLLPELLSEQKSCALTLDLYRHSSDLVKGLEQTFTVFDDMRKPKVDWLSEAGTIEMVGGLSPQNPFRQRLRDLLLRFNNSSVRLQETENKLIGVDLEHRRKL